MPKYGKCDFKELKRFEKEFRKLKDEQIQAFMEAFARELAARLLAKVIKRTPVGESKTETVQLKDQQGNPLKFKRGEKRGKIKTKSLTIYMGGTLRRGWTGDKRGSASRYAESIKVKKVKDTYIIEIKNPVHYASYVEYGHRTSSKKGWVKGRFMLTASVNEINTQLPVLMEKRLQELFKGVF